MRSLGVDDRKTKYHRLSQSPLLKARLHDKRHFWHVSDNSSTRPQKGFGTDKFYRVNV